MRRLLPSTAGEAGQGAVEMALTLPLVFTLIVTCLELGFAFNGYITLANAAREGARAGAVYLYDSNYSQSQNDQNRESGTGAGTPYTDNIRDTVARSLGILKGTSPNFDKNTNVTISYNPSPNAINTRKGSLVTVRVTYRYDYLTQALGNNPNVTLTAEASARIE